jgi:hypothetical protein
MPGQFINTGNTPGGKLSLVNTNNTGNLNLSVAGGGGGPYTIGQAALGGIIAYITGGGSTGTSGLVISSTDISTGADWGCPGTPITTSTSFGAGIANTGYIITNCPTPGIAASLCTSLTDGGYYDWYLGSQNELLTIFANYAAIGLDDHYYWSSSAAGNNFAWLVRSRFDQIATDSRSNSSYVRAIRSF